MDRSVVPQFDWRCVARMIVSYVALTLLLHCAGTAYSRLWRPVFTAQLAVMQNDFRVLRLDTRDTGQHSIFALTAATTARLSLPAGMPFSASTLQAYAHHHLILVLSLLMAWPAHSVRARLRLLLAGLVAVALATPLDVPFALLGISYDLIGSAVPLDAYGKAAVLYFDFLQRGGRWVLTLAAAAAAIATASPPRLVGNVSVQPRHGLARKVQ